MRVKRFVGTNMQDIMAKMKTELGNEAVILHTKKIKEGGFFGFFAKDMIEVTAAVETLPLNRVSDKPIVPLGLPIPPVSAVHPTAAAESDIKKNGSADSKLEPLKTEIEELKLTVETLRSQLKPQNIEPADQNNWPQPIQQAYQRLLQSDVSEPLAKGIVKQILEVAGKRECENIEFVFRLLQSRLETKIGEPKPIEINGKQQIVALVGPTGVGKTTTLAKLAATFSIVDKKKVALITADTYRIAAVEQLKTFGEIIGVPVEVVFSPQGLETAMDKLSSKDLILLDTAGRSHRNQTQMEELKGFLEVAKPTDVILVLSATTKGSDIEEIISHFKPLAFSKIIITKLDETGKYGSILSAVSDANKPLAYITTGQNVPDDIEIARPDKVAKLISGEMQL